MKRKFSTKLVSMLLAGTMMMGLVACQNADVEETTTTTESTVQETTTTPVTSEPEKEDFAVSYPVDTDVELSFWVGNTLKPYSGNTYDNNPVHVGLEENTGVGIKWVAVPEGGDATQSYNLLWTEKDKPEVVFFSISNASAQQLEMDGLIYDLTNYLPEYAPDFWEYMNRPENEKLLKGLSTDDGKILRIPQIQESQYNQTYIGYAIRQDWLDECGLKAPVTIAEWENVLKTFKEKYNAGMAYVNWMAQESGLLASGFDALGFMPLNMTLKDGKVTSPVVEPEYKAMMETMVDWYSKGYIDQDSITLDGNGLRAKALNGEAGIILTAMSGYTNVIADAEAEGNGANWVALEYPRVAEGHPTSMIGSSPSRVTNNSAVVTTSATEDELKIALQFLNYAFCEEGIQYMNFGEEGVSYELDANGKPQFTAAITEDELGLNEAVAKYTVHANGCYGIQMADMVAAKNHPTVAAAVYDWTENTVVDDNYMPPVSFTADENDEIVDLKAATRTYVSEETVKFLTGERPISEWDAFVEELIKLGMQDYIDINQAAYDRWLAK